jgi:hypothetical protein
MMGRRSDAEVQVGRRTVAALGLGATLALAACSTDREVTRPEPEPVTTERLTDALITIDDLPGSFTAAEDETTIATELVPEHDCDDRLGELAPEDAVSADFAGGGASLSSTVAWFPGAGGAVEQLLRDVAADCASVVVPDEDLAIRTGGLDFGVLSDDTLALRVEVEGSSGPIQERDLILRREGDLVHIIRLTGPRPSDKGLLDSVTRLAIGRLGFLRDETT